MRCYLVFESRFPRIVSQRRELPNCLCIFSILSFVFHDSTPPLLGDGVPAIHPPATRGIGIRLDSSDSVFRNAHKTLLHTYLNLLLNSRGDTVHTRVCVRLCCLEQQLFGLWLDARANRAPRENGPLGTWEWRRQVIANVQSLRLWPLGPKPSRWPWLPDNCSRRGQSKVGTQAGKWDHCVFARRSAAYVHWQIAHCPSIEAPGAEPLHRIGKETPGKLPCLSRYGLGVECSGLSPQSRR